MEEADQVLEGSTHYSKPPPETLWPPLSALLNQAPSTHHLFGKVRGRWTVVPVGRGQTVAFSGSKDRMAVPK